MKSKSAVANPSRADATREIDAWIAAVDDWRGPALARLRRWIREADGAIVETVKWRKPTNPAGVPVWERAGVLCSGGVFKGKVKLTFAHGAELDDPSRVFNASLEGNAMRAIDLQEGDTVDEAAFKSLVRGAVERNVAVEKARGKR